MLIPERITHQYFQFCAETDFTPMSKRTLLRVLKVCSASVRKSLQGLDNFSAQGSKAFENLCETVDRIAEQEKSQAWAKEKKLMPRSAKQYLRADYKVERSKGNLFSILSPCILSCSFLDNFLNAAPVSGDSLRMKDTPSMFIVLKHSDNK